MIFPENFESIIGFEPLRLALVELCRFESSKVLAHEFQLIRNRDELIQQFDYLDECSQLLDQFPSLFQFPETADISEGLKRIHIENWYFSEEELLAVLRVLQSFKKLTDTLQSRQEQFPQFAKLFIQNDAVKPCSDAIIKILDEDATLKSNASSVYQKLTQEINRLEKEARSLTKSIFREWKNAGYTAETDITVREERLVIPIIAEFKRKVQGFVKDVSATGKILYVEPSAILEINNLLKELFAERRRERERILKDITSFLRPFQPDLDGVMQKISVADFLYAKFTLCKQFNGQRAKIIEGSGLTIKQGVHPVLKRELSKQNRKIIPLDLQLVDRKMVVISGPNAGGKSVVLKTTLLLQYMFQCGFYVTALPESEFGLVDYMAIDCGDGQSLEQGLSTFSAHLKNVQEILANANIQSLIALDEIGAGTDPRFGAPIAQAVLEKLLESQSLVLATTHFSQLREWGAGISQVSQASMAYDVRELKPLYQFSMGKPGSSFALELMRKTGFDIDWINRIESLTGTEVNKTEDLMLQLEHQNQYLLKLISENERKSSHLTQLQDEYQKLKDKLQSKRKEVVDVARWEAQKLLAETNQQIENTIRVIREHGAKKEPTLKARKELEKFKETVEHQIQKSNKIERPKISPEKQNEVQLERVNLNNLLPGAKVQTINTDQLGEVVEIKKNKVLVAFGLLKMWVPAEDLFLSSNSKSKKIQNQKTGFNWVERQAGFSIECDVRGERTEEAIRKIQLWLDEGYALGQRTLKIIHGRGDGILKKMIRTHLKTLNFVKRYYDEHADRGGDGCTFVELN